MRPLQSPRIVYTFFTLLQKSFVRAHLYALRPKVMDYLKGHGISHNSNQIRCTSLLLVLMKDAPTADEYKDKEKLLNFLLELGMSVLSSGVDHSGNSWQKYASTLSPKMYAALRNRHFFEYKKLFPQEFAEQVALIRKREAQNVAEILTNLKTVELK